MSDIPGGFVILQFYLTVIVHFTDLLPDFTVITAVPFCFALITPFEVTVATFLLLDVYVTFWRLVSGVTTGFKVAV